MEDQGPQFGGNKLGNVSSENAIDDDGNQEEDVERLKRSAEIIAKKVVAEFYTSSNLLAV